MPMAGVVGDLISFLVAQIDRFVGMGSKINMYGAVRKLCETMNSYCKFTIYFCLQINVKVALVSIKNTINTISAPFVWA